MFISSLLCWDINHGSLLVEERVQEIELSGDLCDYGCLEIQPYFKFIDDKTIEVELLTIDNGNITTKKLTNSVYQKGLDVLLVNPAEDKDCCGAVVSVLALVTKGVRNISLLSDTRLVSTY